MTKYSKKWVNTKHKDSRKCALNRDRRTHHETAEDKIVKILMNEYDTIMIIA